MRKLTVVAGYTVCDRCKHRNVLGLEFEGSGGEYGDLSICRDCIDHLMGQVTPPPVIEDISDESSG